MTLGKRLEDNCRELADLKGAFDRLDWLEDFYRRAGNEKAAKTMAADAAAIKEAIHRIDPWDPALFGDQGQ